MDATILINRGTVKANLNFGDWDGDQVEDVCAFINYGSIQGNLFQDCIGALVNQGEMTIRSARSSKATSIIWGICPFRGWGRKTSSTCFVTPPATLVPLPLRRCAGYLTLTNGLYFIITA